MSVMKEARYFLEWVDEVCTRPPYATELMPVQGHMLKASVARLREAVKEGELCAPRQDWEAARFAARRVVSWADETYSIGCLHDIKRLRQALKRLDELERALDEGGAAACVPAEGAVTAAEVVELRREVVALKIELGAARAAEESLHTRIENQRLTLAARRGVVVELRRVVSAARRVISWADKQPASSGAKANTNRLRQALKRLDEGGGE